MNRKEPQPLPEQIITEGKNVSILTRVQDGKNVSITTLKIPRPAPPSPPVAKKQ